MATVGFDMIDRSEKPKASTRIILGDGTISEQVMRMAGKLQDDEIVLDNTSTINLFGNADLLSDITRGGTVSVTGVGGDMQVNCTGTYCKVLDIHFHEHLDCNILAQARVEDVVKAKPGASIAYDPYFDVNIPSASLEETTSVGSELLRHSPNRHS